jgi:predicted HicB family RNase H-like nuclease
VHFSDEDNLFYGKLEFIRALVSYEGTDVQTLRRAFETAVDDYLQMCSKAGRKPEQLLLGII